MASSADYNNSVFINCPFDKDYMLLFHAIIFTVYRCGFLPVCALAEDDASDTRLDVRDWLYTLSKRKTIPFHPVIQKDYNRFIENLSGLVVKSKLNIIDIPFNDYCQIVEDFISEKYRINNPLPLTNNPIFSTCFARFALLHTASR